MNLCNFALIYQKTQMTFIEHQSYLTKGKSLKDMPVIGKLKFEGFDIVTQPQKPHWKSVQACF